MLGACFGAGVAAAIGFCVGLVVAALRVLGSVVASMMSVAAIYSDSDLFIRHNKKTMLLNTKAAPAQRSCPMGALQLPR